MLTFYPCKEQPNPTSRALDMAWLVGVGQTIQHVGKILVSSLKSIWCIKMSNSNLVSSWKLKEFLLTFHLCKEQSNPTFRALNMTWLVGVSQNV